MMPNVTRGGSSAGLMAYLFGAGKRNEHTDQHIIAGDDVLMSAYGQAERSADLPLDVALHLDEPMKAFGRSVTVPDLRWDPDAGKNVKIGDRPGHVWHCSLSLRADEAALTDQKWSQIATDFVREMGFVSEDLDVAGCRWVAVRHGTSSSGNDHIHIAVNLLREDGTKVSVHNDFKRAQKVVNSLEHKYGLNILESRESGQEKPRGASPAEIDRQRSTGTSVPGRDELRRRLRAAAGVAQSEREFIERAHAMRVLLRPRFATGGRDAVVGYSAALVPEAGQPLVFFGGAKLDHSLGLGALRSRWGSDRGQTPGDALLAWTSQSREAKAKAFSVAEKASIPRLPNEAIERLNALGHNVIPDRGTSVERLLSVRISEVYAAASIQFERDCHGAFAAASNEFSRFAAPRSLDARLDEGTTDADFLTESLYLSRLVKRATGRDSSTGWIAVLRQLDRAARAAAERASERSRYALSAQLLAATTSASEQTRQIIANQVRRPDAPAPSAQLHREASRGDQYGRD